MQSLPTRPQPRAWSACFPVRRYLLNASSARDASGFMCLVRAVRNAFYCICRDFRSLFELHGEHEVNDFRTVPTYDCVKNTSLLHNFILAPDGGRTESKKPG